MLNKLLILVIDGCGLDYISKENTPNFYRIAKQGFCKCVKSAIPSVTNVNHATILSGKFPNEHGVVGNYYYDRKTGIQSFVEDSKFVKTDTILDYYRKQGKTTALLTVKGKVLEVFGSHVDFGISVEKPSGILADYLDMDMPPEVGTLEANLWILKACYQLIKKNDPSMVYCTTNDYMMHNYAPDTEEAKAHMGEIDRIIESIYDLNPKREIYITADHGMNKKTQIIDLQIVMDRKDYNVVCHPPIKDRYIENHAYQEGGVLYLYLMEEGKKKEQEIIRYLEEQPYIETVYTREEAAKTFSLPVDGIGDYVVFAAEDWAFGELAREKLITDEVRTHGSLHERAVPLIAVNGKEDGVKYRYSRDIVRIIMEQEETKSLK